MNLEVTRSGNSPIHTSDPGKFVMFIITCVGRHLISPFYVMCMNQHTFLVADTFLLHMAIRSTNGNEGMVVLKGTSHIPKGGNFV